VQSLEKLHVAHRRGGRTPDRRRLTGVGGQVALAGSACTHAGPDAPGRNRAFKPNRSRGTLDAIAAMREWSSRCRRPGLREYMQTQPRLRARHGRPMPATLGVDPQRSESAGNCQKKRPWKTWLISEPPKCSLFAPRVNSRSLPFAFQTGVDGEVGEDKMECRSGLGFRLRCGGGQLRHVRAVAQLKSIRHNPL
jgi:hypothetical protein